MEHSHCFFVFFRIGREKVERLTTEVEEAQKYLVDEPKSTEEFVKYLEYIELAQTKADEMEAELDYCKELYDIMEEFQITVSYDELNNYLGLSVTMGVLRNMVDKKIEEHGKIVKRLSDQMNKDISALIAEVGAIKDDCLVFMKKLIYHHAFLIPNTIIATLALRYRIKRN